MQAEIFFLETWEYFSMGFVTSGMYNNSLVILTFA
jgi:hypothetical protein